jgi:hypothetical protein
MLDSRKCRGPSTRSPRYRWLVAVALMAIAAPLVAPTVAQAAPNPKLEIAVLSSRADMVSGGDALVEVKLPKHVDPEDVKISLDGRDISGQFAVRPNGAFEGLVTDLHEGTNEVTACISRGASKHCVMLTVTNHSLQGPIFAGKQVQPWICDTENFGLGPASGPACVAATRNDFFYKSTNTNTFVTYDPASPPAAALIATTTTDQGKTVPYIVRRERGVIDRGIYDIAVLFDPAKDWQPWAPQPAWNGKLLMSLGGGGSAAHRQGAWGIPDVLNTFDLGDLPLSRGFAVATGTLLLNQNNFSDIVEAEALMMIKEHFIKRYGPVLYTLSVGASSGGNSQYAIADNYPGLLDGLLPQVAAPDMFVFYVQAAPDCALIERYIQNASPELWAEPAARAAVGGAAPYGQWCGPSYFKGFPWTGTTISGFDPSNGCLGPTDPVPDWVYNPQTNPAGVRCTIQDYMRNVFGPRASDGFAARPLDNAGVQYGLKALLAGQISPDQFIDLNTKIGGVDIDSHWIPTRTQADLEALSAAYQAGLITFGRQLAKVPIMDTEGFDPTDIHALVRPLMARDRLVAANGNANNQVIWDTSDPFFGSATATRMNGEALITLDQWVANIKADTSRAPLEVKVIRHKPDNAKDTCWKDGEPGAACRPAYSVPRIAAGGPEANNVLKCQLKPINWSDYGSITFTAEQQAQLNKAFPDGVCDWSQPGVDQQPPKAPWLSFMNGVGGQPVGSEPRSVAVR